MKTYMELQAAYISAVKLLKVAAENAYHSDGCPANLTPPTTYEADLLICLCWLKDSDRHIRPHLYIPTEAMVYLGVLDGPDCKCNHAAGAHSSGGVGLCCVDGCDCFKFEKGKKN